MRDQDSPTLTVFVVVGLLLTLAAAGFFFLRSNAARVAEEQAMEMEAAREAMAETQRAELAERGAVAAEAGADRLPVEPAAADSGAAGEASEGDDAARSILATVRGRVVDQRGLPVAGARVRAAVATSEDAAPAIRVVGVDDLPGRFGRAATTGDDGRFELGLERLGAFELRVTHDEHPRAEYTGGAEREREVIDGLVIVLRDGATIAGRVAGIPDGVTGLSVVARESKSTRAAGGAAGLLSGSVDFDFSEMLEGFGITAGARTADVAADGTFVLRGLDPDAAFDLTGTRPGEGPVQRARCTDRVNVRAGATNVVLSYREGLVVVFQVVDAATGAPVTELAVDAGLRREMSIAGMKVPVTPTQRLPQDEFDDGLVVLSGLHVTNDRGALTFTVGAHGYQPHSQRDIDVPRSGHVDLGVVRLQAAPILRVRVVARGGDPVAGARVSLSRPAPAPAGDGGSNTRGSLTISSSVRVPDASSGGPSVELAGHDAGTARATTDERGECELTSPAGGTGVLRVSADGFAPHLGPEFALPLGGAFEREVVLGLGGAVAVSVVDAKMRAVAGATVEHDGPGVDDDAQRSAETDPSGRVTFARLAPGEHRFRVRDDGPQSSGPPGLTVQITGLDEGWRRAAVAEDATVSLQLVAPVYSTVRGIVTLGGEPVEGAAVSLMRGRADDRPDEDSQAEAAQLAQSMFGALLGSAPEKTDASGEFELERAPIGEHRLRVAHPSHAMPAVVPITVLEGRTTTSVELHDTRIAGRVVDSSGQPVRRASVTVRRGGGGAAGEAATAIARARRELGELFGGAQSRAARTDDDGRFELHGVRAGIPLALDVRSRWSVPASSEVGAIAAGAFRDGVEVVVQSAGRVHVTARADQPIAQVRAVWAGPGDGTGEPETHSAVLKNARATIEGLRPGPWRIELDGAGLPPQTVEVTARNTARVAF